MAINKPEYPDIDMEKVRQHKLYTDEKVLEQTRAVAMMLKSFSQQNFDEQVILDAALIATVVTCRMLDNNTFSFSKVSLFISILEIVEANKGRQSRDCHSWR